MDLKSKLAYAKKHVESISRHDDVDADIRKAALRELAEHARREAEQIDLRNQAKIDALLSTTVDTNEA